MQRLEIISRFFLALAASVLLFFVAVAAPPVGVVLMPFVPQPVLALGFKIAPLWGCAALLSAMVIVLLLAGHELAFIYGVFALMAGLIFALLGRLRALELLVATVAGAMFVAASALALNFFGSWTAMVEGFRASMNHYVASMIQVHEKMGFSQESVNLLKEQLPDLVEMTLRLLPGLIFISFEFVVLINVLFLCRRFPERRGQWLALGNFREWKVPDRMVWGLIATGFAAFIPGLGGVRLFAVNLLFIIGVFYFAQGLSVIAFFFDKNNVPRFLRGTAYLLIFFQQIFTLLVAALGLFDLWGDFRRLNKNNLTASRAS